MANRPTPTERVNEHFGWNQSKKSEPPGSQPTASQARKLDPATDGEIKAPEWPREPAPEAFHGLAGEIVQRIAPNTEADCVALLLQYLAAFGNAAGRKAHCVVGERWHFGNLYCVLVGRTARGRKGESWAWIAALMRAAVADWYDESVVGGLSSGEGLIKAVQDIGVTAFGRRILAVEEEFGAVIRVMSRDGNTLSAIIRQAWDGGRLRTLTRNNPLRADEAHTSVVGHITREELRSLLSETDVANGFANRILWAAVRRSQELPEGGGRVDLTSPAAATKLALEHAWRTGQLERNLPSRQLWARHYPRLTGERLGLLGLVTSRAEAQVLRLSLLYALLDRSKVVDRCHLQAALALWDYCERSCTWIFGDSTGNSDADTIMEALRACPDGLIQTEIFRLFHNNRSAAAIRHALALLVDHGAVIPGKTAVGGQPAVPWRLRQQLS